jgi:hypothetical protein
VNILPSGAGEKSIHAPLQGAKLLAARTQHVIFKGRDA